MAKAVIRQWTSMYTTTDPILGEIAHVAIDYHVANGTVNEERGTTFDVAPTDTAAIIKVNAGAAVIADAAVGGYTIIATDIVFQDGSRGV